MFCESYQTEESGKCVSEDSSGMFSTTQNMRLCADTKGKPRIITFFKNAVFEIHLSFITIRKVILIFFKRHIEKSLK